jgi:hypothetical protein
MTTPQGYVVRPLTKADRLPWQQLYEGYLTFYKTALSEDQLDAER